MDVACTFVRRLEDDRADELDRRGFGEAVRGFEIDDVVLVVVVHAGHVLAHQAGARLRLLTADEPTELGVDVGGGGDAQVDRIGADDAQLVGQLDVGWIGDSDLQPAVFDQVRKGSAPRQDVQGDRFGSVRLDALGAEVDHRKPVELGKRVQPFRPALPQPRVGQNQKWAFPCGRRVSRDGLVVGVRRRSGHILLSTLLELQGESRAALAQKQGCTYPERHAALR